MDSDDPETRIDEFEGQLAHQKRIAELERQLAEAKAAAGHDDVIRQRPQDLRQRPQRKRAGSNLGTLIGIIVGGGGICVGGAAALIAVFPSSALWTSAIVCSSPYQLAYKTAHYSYKPGQSGRTVNFQCASDAGSYYANNLEIGGLQALAIALVLGGIFFAVTMFRRGLRKPG